MSVLTECQCLIHSVKSESCPMLKAVVEVPPFLGRA